jgi:hypothetical protein
MNDPGPYRTTFSDLAKSTAAQDAFFESLITFMRRHNFDGVDLDWEYPVADDRGGIADDYENFVTLVRRLRERLNQTGKNYGITITLVSLSTDTSSKSPKRSDPLSARLVLVPPRFQPPGTRYVKFIVFNFSQLPEALKT